MTKAIIEIYDISESIADGKKIKELPLDEFIEELNAAPEFRTWDDEIAQYRIKRED